MSYPCEREGEGVFKFLGISGVNLGGGGVWGLKIGVFGVFMYVLCVWVCGWGWWGVPRDQRERGSGFPLEGEG